MIKIEIKRTYKKGEQPKDQIKNNKYNITLNIDNQAWQTIQMHILIGEVKEHLQNLFKTIPFAIVEIENPEIWEENYLVIGKGYNYQAVKTTA